MAQSSFVFKQSSNKASDKKYYLSTVFEANKHFIRIKYKYLMIENIKSLWKDIDYKTGFIIKFSQHIKRSPKTLHNHWFAMYWVVPENKQKETVEFMQNYIRLQNEKK